MKSAKPSIKDDRGSRRRLGLPRIIDSHMVLQRDAKVPIWGRARPGATVQIEFQGQKKDAAADNRGFWRLMLDPLKAGGPYEMTIRSATETKRLVDVLVGEVWLGVGQSNMTWALANNPALGHISDRATQDFVGKGNYPQIRVSSLAHHLVTTHEGGWMAMSDVATPSLPALMSCMAILLHRQQHVPVGIIVRAFGGVPGSVWMDRDAFENNSDIQDALNRYAKTDYPPQRDQYLKDFSTWTARAAAAKAKGTKPPPEPYRPASSASLWASGSGLYMSYLAPLVPYGVRGIVWDQGEAGTGVPGVKQQDLLAALVGGWRNAWTRSELPLIYIRKVEYGAGPVFADFTRRMDQVPNCWMVDNEGLSHVLHPPDKLEYAKRLVAVILKVTCGAPIGAAPHFE